MSADSRVLLPNRVRRLLVLGGFLVVLAGCTQQAVPLRPAPPPAPSNAPPRPLPRAPGTPEPGAPSRPTALQPPAASDTAALDRHRIAEIVAAAVDTEIRHLQRHNPTITDVDYAHLAQQVTREWQDDLTEQLTVSPSALPPDIEERIRASVRQRFFEQLSIADAHRRAEAPDATVYQDEAAERRQQWLAQGWSPTIIDAVLSQRVMIGMTKPQVEAAWGKPDQRVTDVLPNAVLEYWTYINGSTQWQAVHFRDGVVESLHQQE
jgi:hypothetical protein